MVFGRSSTATIQLSALGSGGFVIEGAAAGDFVGKIVSGGGDMNGDGLADVVVAAPSAYYNAGEVYVVLGKTGNAAVNLGTLGTQGFSITGYSSNDAFAFANSGGGDINGDGLADLLCGAPLLSRDGVDNVGVAYVLFSPFAFAPLTTPTTATYTETFAAGALNHQSMGRPYHADDRANAADGRLWVAFDGGAGPGLANSSQATVALTRSDAGIAEFQPSAMANVQWQLGGNRTGWTTASVIVNYTEAEVAGLVESDLKLFVGPGPAGPFVLATNFTLDVVRNRATGDLASLPATLILSTLAPDATPPGVGIARQQANPTGNQVMVWSVTFDEPITGSVVPGEILPTGSLAASVVFKSVTPPPQPFTVTLVSNVEVADGTLSFDLAPGAVIDLVGNPSPATPAPAYEVEETGGVPGDATGDGLLTVEDITAIGNYIVNGTPLP